MRSVRLGLFFFLTLSACGESKVPSAPGPGNQVDSGPDDTYTRDAGPKKNGDAGRQDAGMMKAAGPQVTITSPTAATDPNADEIITQPTVKVSCQVERATEVGSAAVDKSSVKISMQDTADPEKWIDAPVNATPGDIYEANFELSKLPNGNLHFRCLAKDLATMPNSTTVMLDTFLDLGPTIEIVSPNQKIYTLKTPVPIEFKVTANPVSDDDKEADVDSIKLLVAGVETKFEESKMTPGLYQTSVDFEDRLQFPVPPESAQIAISATNKRSPAAATRDTKVDITIDGNGPTIVVKSPADGEIVHGERVLELEITDPAGVRRSSVLADFNQGLYVIRDWEGTEPTAFRQRFDTRRFGTALTRLTISITAMDGVGNETTKPLILKLDNLPPVISLTPPLIREWRMGSTRGECSTMFDPVGDDVPDDLGGINGSAYFRVLVEDKTNQPASGPDGAVTYIAGVDANTVEVYMQRDITVPLLIDTDHDGTCDEINSEALAQDVRPLKIALGPVTPTGTSWYRYFDTMATEVYYEGVKAPKYYQDPYPDNPDCATTTATQPPMQPAHPAYPCNGTARMWRVVPGRSTDRPPAVYGLRPGSECTGEYWELSSIVKQRGWICVAARAQDKIGNIGVSDPERLCFDERDSSVATPDCSATPAPTCTDGCTISAAQRFAYDKTNTSWFFP